MNMGHDFSFNGGELLRGIGAAWFVSYAYYSFVDKEHKNWENGISKNSLSSRRSKYNCSTAYHKEWLDEIKEMEQLDKHKNSVCLSSTQLKDMTSKILSKRNS